MPSAATESTTTHPDRPAIPMLLLAVLAGVLLGIGIIVGDRPRSVAAAGGDVAGAESAKALPELEPAEAVRLAREWERRTMDLVAQVEPAFVRIGPGSGALISPDGLLITNHHVIGERHANVFLPDGRGFRAINIAQDPRGDIVLMQLLTDEPVPYLPLADSARVQPGDNVIALGNPFLLAEDDPRPAVSSGIVSAVHRYMQGYVDAIQTDAKLNPGNSGGPLINMDGELIGINGRIAVRRGFGYRLNSGIGYAISSNYIRRLIARMQQTGGMVRQGMIDGLELATLARPVPRTDGMRGLEIQRVRESHATRIGLRRGDYLLSIDGEPLPSVTRFWSIMAARPEGTRVRLAVARDGEILTLGARLAPVGTLNSMELIPNDAGAPDPPVEADDLLPPVLAGIELPEREIQPGYLGLTIDEAADPRVLGCPIGSVAAGSPAARAGLEVGDVIMEYNRIVLGDFPDLRNLLNRSLAGEEVRLTVESDGIFRRRTRTVTVTLSTRPN